MVKYHDTLTFRDGLNGLECVLQIEPQAPKRGLVRKVREGKSGVGMCGKRDVDRPQ